MTRLKVAELTSGVGALVLGVGLGALFPLWFGAAAGSIDVLQRPPRHPDEPMLGRPQLRSIVATAMVGRPATEARARTKKSSKLPRSWK